MKNKETTNSANSGRTANDRDSAAENPYLSNRADWNEIVGKEKAEKVMWRLFALLELIPLTVAIGGMIYASQLPEVVPFIFKEDASGGITPLGIPNKEFRADNAYVGNQLAEFIVALRQVPSSKEMRRIAVHHVKMMTDPILFRNRLGGMLTDQYAAVGAGEQLISINTIMPEPNEKFTWEIDWTETRGTDMPVKYKGLITYAQLPRFNKSTTELMWNPLNIVINDVTINPVLGGK